MQALRQAVAQAEEIQFRLHGILQPISCHVHAKGSASARKRKAQPVPFGHVSDEAKISNQVDARGHDMVAIVHEQVIFNAQALSPLQCVCPPLF
jgi:hypothetical protein